MMATENRNEDLLSSWKEISAYLKCGVRSCIRWEKERGLPVHRMSESSVFRVYAYKAELDQWLVSQLNRKEIAQGHETARNIRIRRYILLALPAILVVLALIFVLRPKPGPPPFMAGDFSIITTEPAPPGHLRVWEAAKSGEYREIWGVSSSRYNTVVHTTVAAGDIDGDGITELAAPAAAKITFYRNEREVVYYPIFINFYKKGKRGLWKTTFYSEPDWVNEEGNFRKNEVILANLNNAPGDEIVLKTGSWLAVFDYRAKSGEIKLVNSTNQFLKGKTLALKSVATARMDRAGPSAILVAANEAPEEKEGILKALGWLLTLVIEDGSLKVVKAVPVDAVFQDYALRTGDVDWDGKPEVYATASRPGADGEAFFLLGWDGNGNKIADIRLDEPSPSRPAGAALAMSDLTFEAGEDILIGLKPRRLLLFSWQANRLALLRDYEIGTPGVSINSLVVGDTDLDNRKEIIVAGAATPKSPDEGRSYLEVLGFRSGSDEIYPKWKRVGADKAAGEIGFVTLAHR